jgi:hypothetical protein
LVGLVIAGIGGAIVAAVGAAPCGSSGVIMIAVPRA